MEKFDFNYSHHYFYRNYFRPRELQKNNFSAFLDNIFEKLDDISPEWFGSVLKWIFFFGILLLPCGIIFILISPISYMLSYIVWGVYFYLFFYLYDRSKNRLKKESEELLNIIENRYKKELNIYFYIYQDLWGLKNIDEYRNKVKNIRSYLNDLERTAQFKFDNNFIEGLLKIHFNTDYDKTHNYSTKHIHPFFVELKELLKNSYYK